MDKSKQENSYDSSVIDFSEYKRKKGITYLDNSDKLEYYQNKSIYITWPTDFDDAILIIKEMLNGNAVLMNIYGMPQNTGQRLIDFICGACYVLNYTINFISDNIFLITYENQIQAVE